MGKCVNCWFELYQPLGFLLSQCTVEVSNSPDFVMH